MIKIGTYNYLKVKSVLPGRLILTDGLQDIELLSPEGDDADIKPGDEILVFVYRAQNGALVATAKRPFACAGDFACLNVLEENDLGSFMDIGLDTPLFVPFSNQVYPFEIGFGYVVYIFLDDSGILTASSWLDDYIDTDVSKLEEGDQASLLIFDISEVACYAIVNNRYIGTLNRREVYESLEIGDLLQGYVRKIKPESNRVELSLNQPGFEFVVNSKELLLDLLRKNGGSLDLGDKSRPEEIHKQLKMSKKIFKRIIGGLYKDRLITISDHQIQLVAKL